MRDSGADVSTAHWHPDLEPTDKAVAFEVICFDTCSREAPRSDIRSQNVLRGLHWRHWQLASTKPRWLQRQFTIFLEPDYCSDHFRSELIGRPQGTIQIMARVAERFDSDASRDRRYRRTPDCGSLPRERAAKVFMGNLFVGAARNAFLKRYPDDSACDPLFTYAVDSNLMRSVLEPQVTRREEGACHRRCAGCRLTEARRKRSVQTTDLGVSSGDPFWE